MITSREVATALRDIKSGTATGNDHINIDILKAGEDTISNTLAKLIRKANTHGVEERQDIDILQEGKQERPQKLQTGVSTIIYKVLTKDWRRHSTKTSHVSKLDSVADTQRRNTSTS